MEMTIHGYEEGCGFNATIPGTDQWRSRYPMNAYDLRLWVEKHPAALKFTGDVKAVQEALNG